jgi:hypothetical protein
MKNVKRTVKIFNTQNHIKNVLKIQSARNKVDEHSCNLINHLGGSTVEGIVKQILQYKRPGRRDWRP